MWEWMNRDMKHFKIIGPETTREFDIEDDELIFFKASKIIDYENHQSKPNEQIVKNDKIYPTKKEWSIFSNNSLIP